MAPPKRDFGWAAAHPSIHGGVSGALFSVAKSQKQSEKYNQQLLKKRAPKNINTYAERVSVDRTDAKTHQNPMPKLVTKKIMEIIENHVSLNGKIIQIHCKSKCV